MNCRYCESPLIRFGAHPSWSVCPKCEPRMVQAPVGKSFYEQVLGHAMDHRGRPSR